MATKEEADASDHEEAEPHNHQRGTESRSSHGDHGDSTCYCDASCNICFIDSSYESHAGVVWFVHPVQLLSMGALEGMSALRRSEDLLSLKTRRIVIQNEDSSYPPAGAVLAMDPKGRGGTVITQDVSLNSVALMGQTTAGILTYSDVSGLLVNSEPISTLPAPVSFDSVADSSNLSGLIESYNQLLAVLNGAVITVNLPPSVTGLVAAPDINTADLSWNSVGSGYTYTVDLCGSNLATDVSGTTYQLTSLAPATTYTASVSAHNNSVFSSLPTSVSFTTDGLPVVSGLVVSNIDVTAASITWTSVGGSYTYNVYRGATFLANESGTSYSLTELTATTAYTISVRVTDGTNEGSPASNSFTTATPLTVTASAVTGTGATISWNSAGSGYLYNLQIVQGSTVIETLTGLTDLSYSVVDLNDSTTYIASVRFTSTGFTSSSAYTTTFRTSGPTSFGFFDRPYGERYEDTSNEPGVYSAGYRVDIPDSPWIGNQFNTITLKVKSTDTDTGNTTTSGVKINIYNSLNTDGSLLASSETVDISGDNDYVIPLSTTVTLARPMLIQFECTSTERLQFRLFTLYTTPFTTMTPVLISNNPPSIINFVNPDISSFIGGFYCQFSLV